MLTDEQQTRLENAASAFAQGAPSEGLVAAVEKIVEERIAARESAAVLDLLAVLRRINGTPSEPFPSVESVGVGAWADMVFAAWGQIQQDAHRAVRKHSKPAAA